MRVKGIFISQVKNHVFSKQVHFISGLVLSCFLLTACSYDVLHYSDSSTRKYASNNAGVSSIPSSGYHRVQKGETLFSIAFRYGVDYKTLAKNNNIRAPYVIYPQQKIRLSGVKKSTITASSPSPKTTPSSRASTSTKTTKSPSNITLKKPVKPTVSDTKDDKPVSDWSWPVDGSVTRGFSNTGVSSKGIDIKAELGALVKAAANGTVVYAGNGLIGYGNLVIVQHNGNYLSAYAYNESILVKEKQEVKAGDSLAIIGGKGEDRPLLHFEVRRDGQPIDPLIVLPKRN